VQVDDRWSTPAGRRNGNEGFSPTPVGMAIPNDGKVSCYPKSHPGAHRHKRFGWGCSPILKQWHTSSMVSLESLTNILSIYVKTETMDYIAPFTIQSPYKFCLGEGRGGLDLNFGEKCGVRGLGVVGYP